MILGLHHAAIAVPDMQSALDFYVDVLVDSNDSCGFYLSSVSYACAVHVPIT